MLMVEQGVPFGKMFLAFIAVCPSLQSLHFGPVTTNKVIVYQHMRLNFLKSILLLVELLGGAHARGDHLLDDVDRADKPGEILANSGHFCLFSKVTN